MKFYTISGLGADQRVFNDLNLNYEIVPLEWIDPQRDESIESYSLRLSKVINTDEEFGLIGVSFGGLVAVEIAKNMNPAVTVLISSAEVKTDLRNICLWLGKSGVLTHLPEKLFDVPRRLAYSFFGAKNKLLLKQILDDTDYGFAKWAVNELVNWSNTTRLAKVIKIHGTNDKMIPAPHDKNIHLIDKGEHFMIVDRAEEVSNLINRKTREFLLFESQQKKVSKRMESYLSYSAFLVVSNRNSWNDVNATLNESDKFLVVDLKEEESIFRSFVVRQGYLDQTFSFEMSIGGFPKLVLLKKKEGLRVFQYKSDFTNLVKNRRIDQFVKTIEDKIDKCSAKLIP